MTAGYATIKGLRLYYETRGTGREGLRPRRATAGARLAVVPGTSHAGLCDRAAWVVPMIEEFLTCDEPA